MCKCVKTTTTTTHPNQIWKQCRGSLSHAYGLKIPGRKERRATEATFSIAQAVREKVAFIPFSVVLKMFLSADYGDNRVAVDIGGQGQIMRVGSVGRKRGIKASREGIEKMAQDLANVYTAVMWQENWFRNSITRGNIEKNFSQLNNLQTGWECRSPNSQI